MFLSTLKKNLTSSFLLFRLSVLDQLDHHLEFQNSGKLTDFVVWLRILFFSAGIEPVLSHTLKKHVSYFREFFTNNKTEGQICLAVKINLTTLCNRVVY